MASPFINDPTREASYFAGRSGLWALGKHSAEVLGETLAEIIKYTIGPDAFNNVASMAGGISGIAGLITVGLAAAVSAGLTQMDYIHRSEGLKSLYKEELSAKLKKPIGKLERSDLDTLAKSNEVIREEMARSRKQRNYGVGLSVIASMASLAVIVFALPNITMLHPLLEAKALTLAGAVGLALKAVVGLTTYHMVKDPLHHIADHFFGLDDLTTNDYIVTIKRDREKGKAISREQVLSVFAAANPALDKYIVAEYGKHFDDLSVTDKARASTELNNVIPLDRLTLEINSGKINVSELAFAVEGQISGVNHEISAPEKPKVGLLGSVVAGISKLLHFNRPDMQHEATVAAVAQASVVVNSGQGDQAEGFVARMGLSSHDPKLGHVQQLEQSRNDASAIIGFPG